jgi:hypothetical protein
MDVTLIDPNEPVTTPFSLPKPPASIQNSGRGSPSQDAVIDGYSRVCANHASFDE